MKPFLGGTAYFTIVEIYQATAVNHFMGGMQKWSKSFHIAIKKNTAKTECGCNSIQIAINNTMLYRL